MYGYFFKIPNTESSLDQKKYDFTVIKKSIIQYLQNFAQVYKITTVKN